MSMINFLLELVISVLFIATSMTIIKWKRLTKGKKEGKLYSRMSFGLFILGVYALLSALDSLMVMPLIINPVYKIIELSGLVIIMFGFLEFLEVKNK